MFAFNNQILVQNILMSQQHTEKQRAVNSNTNTDTRRRRDESWERAKSQPVDQLEQLKELAAVKQPKFYILLIFFEMYFSIFNSASSTAQGVN